VRILGIGEKLNVLLKIRGRNINELASTLSISPQTLYSIAKRNNTKVDLDILQKIADELSVTLDYFCSDTSNSNNSITLNQTEKDLILIFRDLSEQGQEYILQTIDMVKDKYKKDLYSSDSQKIG
jgi:transcriptional regulator with XRE-family HTH domain